MKQGTRQEQSLQEAQGWERNAYYWGEKINDHAYLERIRFTPADAERQIDIAAYFAEQAYKQAASGEYLTIVF